MQLIAFSLLLFDILSLIFLIFIIMCLSIFFGLILCGNLCTSWTWKCQLKLALNKSITND